MQAPKEAVLTMNWYEAGALRGSLEVNDMFKKLPTALQLKLKIIFAQAYLNHPVYKKGAEKEIKEYQGELDILGRG